MATDLFLNAKEVRLQSHHDKYLTAGEDEESVTQDRNGSSKNARWTVEFVPDTTTTTTIIRLKSCYGKYLTASNQPFLLGMTGRKVLQTLPRRLDSSLDWEPIRDGHNQVKLREERESKREKIEERKYKGFATDLGKPITKENGFSLYQKHTQHTVRMRESRGAPMATELFTSFLSKGWMRGAPISFSLYWGFSDSFWNSLAFRSVCWVLLGIGYFNK